MNRLIDRRHRLLFWTVGVAYVSLTVWMHIWALEAGLPRTDQPAKPHHQVCTWIGTSGEAGSVVCLDVIRPIPIVFYNPVSLSQTPVLPVFSETVRARAPPILS
ncbi:MAG: hypothetical protein AB7G48_11615 [Nitrospiraceae bacterium]